MVTLTRGELLRSSALLAGSVATGELFRPLAAAAQGAPGGASTVAGSIAQSVANGIAKQTADYFFGSFMTAIGLNGTNSAVLDALHEIEQQLDEIEAQLREIENFLKAELASIAYQSTYNVILPIITANQTLRELYLELAAETSTRDKTIAHITSITTSAQYLTARNLWNNVLTGQGFGRSLIKLFGAATYASAQTYGPKQAQAMTAWWDFMDTQQLLTTTYLADTANFKASGRSPNYSAYMQRWFANRQNQLTLIRGIGREYDVMTDPISNTRIGTRSPSYLAPNTMYSKSTNLVWYTNPVGPQTVRNIEDQSRDGGTPLYWLLFFQGFEATRQTIVQAPQSSSNLSNDAVDNPWLANGLSNRETTENFLKDCGVALGSGSDDLVSPLRSAGFQIPNDFLRCLVGGDAPYQGTPGKYFASGFFMQGGSFANINDMSRDDPFYILFAHAPKPSDSYYAS